MKPLVSIIVPCYNQAKYISETLKSILQQTYQNWECLIINDGSPDNTDEIVSEWLEKDNRFQYIKKTNTGVCDTRNKGIEKAKGTYILPLDADDKIAPQYISEAIDEFERDDSIKLIYCNKILFGAVNIQKPCPPYSFETMLSENLIHNAGIFRKRDFNSTKGYNLNMHDGLEDWDFWITFLDPKDKVVKLDGYYLYYRIKKIARSTQIDLEKNERLILQIFKNNQDKYLEYYNPIRDHINHLYYKNKFELLQNSKEYKLGKLFFYPLHLIKRVKNKLWRR